MLSKNKNGHYVLTVTGLDFSGVEEIYRLESAGYTIGPEAKKLLLDAGQNSYDANHRLIDKEEYPLVLIPSSEINSVSRNSAKILSYAEKFGYFQPKAGVIPRIREALSDSEIKEMGFFYLAAVHERIMKSPGQPTVLRVSAESAGNSVVAPPPYLEPCGWNAIGAFVFFLQKATK